LPAGPRPRSSIPASGRRGFPAQRRYLVAHQPVQHTPRLLRVHQVRIDLLRVLEGGLDGLLGDLVEHHAEDLGTVLAISEFLLQMETDGLPFAVRVSRQVDFFHLFGSLLQLTDELLLSFDYLVARFKPVVYIDGQVAFGQILDVPQRRLHNVLLAEIFIDGFGLRRRLHDYQSLRHKRLSDCGPPPQG
jgi:hypothetical protein